VRALYDETVVQMAARAAAIGRTPLRTYWGSKKLNTPAELVPNSYLWIPLKLGYQAKSTDPTPEGHRAFWQAQHHFQVRCYGETHEIASVMLANVAAVMHDARGGNLSLIGASWSDAVEGEEVIANGELLIGEFAIQDVFVQRYLHVGERGDRRDASQSPVVVPAPTAQPTGFEIRWFTSPDGIADGELLRVDTVPVP